jgi:outer membrane protein assembly factor BamA
VRIIKTLTIILLLITGIVFRINSQTSGNYRLIVSQGDKVKLDEANLIESFKSHVSDHSTLSQWMFKVYEQGYLLANYELSVKDSSSTFINVELGEKFTWAALKQGNLPDELMSRTGYKQSFFEQQIVNFKRISNLFEKIIRYAERNGYPFASIELNALEINDRKLSAEINFNAGQYITFDSLKLSNSNKIKTRFLAAYLKIKPGTPYDQRKIENIPYLINALPYLSIRGDPLLYFANEQCQVILDLNDEKASAFDGIIGFLPNENEEGKLLVTGQVYLKIENLFRSGKRLELDWHKVNIQSQDLSMAYDHPALLGAPLDLALAFNLYKQDTTFLTRKLELNMFYNNYNKGRVGVHFKRDVSRLLHAESLVFHNRPLYADYNLNYYGIVYKFSSLDHLFFPSRGWDIKLDANVGSKSIIKNVNLDDDFYADIPDEGFQWQSTLMIGKYIKLRPRNILLTKVSGGYMNGDQLFLNDLFRLGGLNSIRGFNEMFFYASQYIVGTLEYRYLFENESQLLIFFDGSLLKHELDDGIYSDRPVGLGAGINLATKAGLLNVIYAIGKAEVQPFNIKYSKIHIGYTGRF